MLKQSSHRHGEGTGRGIRSSILPCVHGSPNGACASIDISPKAPGLILLKAPCQLFWSDLVTARAGLDTVGVSVDAISANVMSHLTRGRFAPLAPRPHRF